MDKLRGVGRFLWDWFVTILAVAVLVKTLTVFGREGFSAASARWTFCALFGLVQAGRECIRNRRRQRLDRQTA